MTEKPTYEELERKLTVLEKKLALSRGKVVDRDEKGNPLQFKGTHLDITERKQAEAALRNEKKFSELLINSSVDGILAFDHDCRYTAWNPAMEIISGVRKEKALGKIAFDIFPFLKETGEDNFFFNALAGDTVIAKNRQFKVPETGEQVSFEGHYSPLLNEFGEIIGGLAIVRDITERKMFENKILQARKMEAISSLAGGIAHKFNNSLSGIIGNIELLKLDNPNNPQINIYADRMISTSRHMAGLSNQLLAYAKGGKYRPKIISPFDFIKNAFPLIQDKIDPAIRLDTDLSVDTFNIKGDPEQIQMVLLNVIENATEAIDGEGRIKIMVSNTNVNEQFAKKHLGLKPGVYVNIRVIDDGKGMNEEVRHRIFEPFFTTNFQGRGLGMAAVYGIIKNHNGWIGVDSESDKGSKISIYLPAIDTRVAKLEKQETEILKSKVTLLLIEDEETVKTDLGELWEPACDKDNM